MSNKSTKRHGMPKSIHYNDNTTSNVNHKLKNCCWTPPESKPSKTNHRHTTHDTTSNVNHKLKNCCWIPPDSKPSKSSKRNTSNDVHVCEHRISKMNHHHNTTQNDILKLNTSCWIPKSTSSSSTRVRAGAMAGPIACHRRSTAGGRKRDNKRRKKLTDNFITCPPIPSQIYLWSEEQLLKDYCFVIDGSMEGNETCFKPNHCKKRWKSCSILRQELYVPTLPAPCLGLVHPIDDGLPAYRLLPRHDSLKFTCLLNSIERVNKLCSALDEFERIQRTTLKRGCDIFGDNKYICAGTQPGRNSAGVRDTYHMSKVSKKHLDTVIAYVCQLERLFQCYAESEMIWMVSQAKKLLNYRTLSSPDRRCDIFGAFAFGRNVYLASHQDRDFTYSIITVHVRNRKYLETDDQPVVYFGFPRLGVAIPLRPGDVLLINPLEPHSVSSRCYETDEVFCFSAYLKSANVGLHDNKLNLSSKEETLAKDFDKEMSKVKH
eukprot:scaffold8004_cov60-Cyclotella_meneghiniana.AAC.1